MKRATWLKRTGTRASSKRRSAFRVTARLQRITNAIFGLSKASKESRPREATTENQLKERNLMKRTIAVLACVAIAPLAFGQTVANTSDVEHTGQIQRAPTQITTGAVKVGTVRAFNPGLRNVEPASPIVVQSSPDTKAVSYILGKRVRFVDTDGRAFDPHMVRPGTRVQLGFDRRGMVSRVVVVGETRRRP
jgi:hypothetical protein